MCLQDVLIGRNTHGQPYSKTIGATATLLFGRAKNRFSFIIGQPGSGTLTVWPDPAVTANVGIILTSASAPLTICLKDYGDLVNDAWFGIHSVGGVNVAIAELIFDHKLPLQDF